MVKAANSVKFCYLHAYSTSLLLPAWQVARALHIADPQLASRMCRLQISYAQRQCDVRAHLLYLVQIVCEWSTFD